MKTDIKYDSLVALCWRTKAFRTREEAAAARAEGQEPIRCVLPGPHFHNIKMRG